MTNHDLIHDSFISDDNSRRSSRRERERERFEYPLIGRRQIDGMEENLEKNECAKKPA